MEPIANFIISALDLAEAEGRAAHRGVIRLLVRASAILGAAILGLIGVLLVGWGVYLAVTLLLGPVWAAFACGVFLLVVATGLFIYGRIAPRRKIASKTVDVDPRARTPQPHASQTPPQSDRHNGDDHHETLRPTANPRPVA